MSQIPTLLRKRLIPNETVKLTTDEVIYIQGDIIVTKWKPIRPRTDIGGGESCYLLHKGIKVSRFYDSKGSFKYWYCDIISVFYDDENNEYIFTDLLADVVVYADGFVKVLDIDELVEALDNGLISNEELKKALANLASLLDIVYSKRLYELCGEYLDLARDMDNQKV